MRFTMDWRRLWNSYWGRVIVGSVSLFGVLPLLALLVRRGFDGYAVGVYIGTGIAVLWYTVEAFYLRRAMVLANEIAVLPLVIARIEFCEDAPGTRGYAERVVLRNIGKSPALFIRVADFDVETTDIGTMGMRIEAPDMIEGGQQVAVESYGYLGEGGELHRMVDTLVPHLKPTAQRTHQVEIFYEDIAGGKHESVMQMGMGGIRLLRHS